MKKHIITIIVIFGLLLSTVACESGNPDYQPDELTVHFLELGNKYTGDCVYINYGDIDIIIDAGSKQDSATTITSYINKYIKDNKLEFVIATHAHEDHIAGFNSNASGTVVGVLDYFEIDTIIDFPRTNSNTLVYNRYVATRDKLKANGTAHYTALQCYKNEDGAQRIYSLGGNVKLEILYNYYYDHASSNENNYSVAARIINGTQKYLFTGDLEKSGEDSLVDYYAENHGGLGHHILYKGGHHGSYTSSNEKLMAEIRPEYVCVCSCVGTTEYTDNLSTIFPSQAFIDRVAPYTDKVYLTTLVTDYTGGLYEPFNGNVVFTARGNDISIQCSHNNLKLKDTEWFKENKAMPRFWE